MVEQSRILFVGDSLIAFYDWQDCFTTFECVNLGVPGETVGGWVSLTAQASSRYPVAQYIVLMLGANNICQQDYSFLPLYKELLVDFQGLYPQAQCVVCSLLPHDLPWLGSATVPRLNESLQAMVLACGHVFLDVCTPFQAQGDGCFLEDGVHLSKKGYEVWCNVLNYFFLELDASVG